jgi:L-serine deaminase
MSDDDAIHYEYPPFRDVDEGLRQLTQTLQERFPHISRNAITQRIAKRAARAAIVSEDTATDLDDIAGQMRPLAKIRRDLEYRLTNSGRPLSHIVITREQAVALLQQLDGAEA